MSRFWQVSVGLVLAGSGCADEADGGFSPAATMATTGAMGSTSTPTTDPAPNASSGAPTPDPPPDTSLDVSGCMYAFATSDDPRVVFDVSIDCPNLDLGRTGIAVANTDDEAFVAATHEGRLAVFRTDAEEAVPLPPIPVLFAGPPPLAALDTGALVLPGADHREEPQEHTIWSYVDEWSVDASFSTQTRHSTVGLDSTRGRVDLWLRANDQTRTERRSSEDGWAPHPVSEPGSLPTVFGLDTAGDPIVASVVESPVGWRLSVNEETIFNRVGERPRRLWLAPDASGVLEEASARYLLMTATDDALLVVLPTERHFAVPGTRAVRWLCNDFECDSSCVERESGRFGNSAAVARSADGTIWVSHVHADLDRALSRPSTECGPVGSCECHIRVTTDESTLELRLTAIRADGSVDPQPPIALPGLGADAPIDYDLLAMSVGTDNLAIATRTAEQGLRVILLRP